MRHIPGLSGYWLLGNVPDILKLGQHVLYTEGNKKFGPVFKVCACLRSEVHVLFTEGNKKVGPVFKVCACLKKFIGVDTLPLIPTGHVVPGLTMST